MTVRRTGAFASVAVICAALCASAAGAPTLRVATRSGTGQFAVHCPGDMVAVGGGGAVQQFPPARFQRSCEPSRKPARTVCRGAGGST